MTRNFIEIPVDRRLAANNRGRLIGPVAQTPATKTTSDLFLERYISCKVTARLIRNVKRIFGRIRRLAISWMHLLSRDAT
jgi:hypothetical protein